MSMFQNYSPAVFTHFPDLHLASGTQRTVDEQSSPTPAVEGVKHLSFESQTPSQTKDLVQKELSGLENQE